jgi:hypothetical protein
VETLEALQLLVKTDLFVVVVAINTRYVTLALEDQYKGILEAGRHPSSIDYLEKIIQLPYRLPPIDKKEAMGRYIEEQLGTLREDAVRLESQSNVPAQSNVPVQGDVPAQSNMPAQSDVSAKSNVPAQNDKQRQSLQLPILYVSRTEHSMITIGVL